jgi:hypothetical protein
MNQRQDKPGDRAGGKTEHRTAGLCRDRKSHARPAEHLALDAEIDDAGALGQRLADTIISGVDDRSIAAAHEPATNSVSSAMARAPSSRRAAGTKGCDEQQALEDRRTGARDLGIKLQRVARGNQPSDQDRDRYCAQEMVSGQPRHQEAGQAVADGEAGLQPSLDRLAVHPIKSMDQLSSVEHRP